MENRKIRSGLDDSTMSVARGLLLPVAVAFICDAVWRLLAYAVCPLLPLGRAESKPLPRSRSAPSFAAREYLCLLAPRRVASRFIPLCVLLTTRAASCLVSQFFGRASKRQLFGNGDAEKRYDATSPLHFSKDLTRTRESKIIQ